MIQITQESYFALYPPPQFRKGDFVIHISTNIKYRIGEVWIYTEWYWYTLLNAAGGMSSEQSPEEDLIIACKQRW